jgi:hypothetical protein
MINLAFVFDSYGRQARLYPGLLTLFPPLLTLIAWFPGLITSSIGATLLTIASSCGLLYGLAVLSRSQGKRAEKRLLRKWGGWPTTIWLRHKSEYLQPQTLQRYHQFLTTNVPQLSLPTAEEEKLDARNADFAYASGVKWLQEQCRGKEFPHGRKGKRGVRIPAQFARLASNRPNSSNNGYRVVPSCNY